MSNPRIRVDGFNKNLEKKIFGEIVRSISTRKYIKSVVSDVGEYEVIQQGDTPILGYSNDEPFEKYKSVILLGDHTLSLYRPKAPFLLATDGLKILQSSVLKRDYLYYLTQNYIPTSQGYKRHFSILKKVSVKYSKNSTEQSAIGSLFSTLDDLVVNYKDNLSNYQSLKTTMLSKMFPKAGQTVPEIRLDGFEGEWELLEINDLADDFQSGGTPKTNVQEYWDGNIPWIQSSDLETNCLFEIKVQKSISEKGLKNSSAKIIPKDSIAVVTRVGVGKLVVMRHEYATSQDFLSLSNLKSNIEFTAYLLYRLLQKEITQLQGTSIKGITKVELLSKKVLIPSLLEQQAIGSYFSNLDQLITSYQEKITQLETLKKKLLQDMFI